MSIKTASIKLKVIASMTALVIICSAVLVLLSLYSLSSFSDDELDKINVQLKKSVVNTLKLNAEIASQRVSSLLIQSFEPAKSLSTILSDTATPSPSLSRDDVTRLIGSTLESIQAASALYTQFENNGYDGKDRDFMNQGRHSTPSGSLEIYYVKENGKSVLYPVDDPDEKYLSNTDSNGIREAEWYLCSKDTKAPCVLDPYLYEIEPGNEALMTTLSQPILVNGQFRGLVGLDINLPVMQQWLEEYSKDFFDGEANLTLLSQRTMLVASSEFKSLLGKKANEASPKFDTILKSSGSVSQIDGHWYVKHMFKIADTQASWTLIVSIPEEVAIAQLMEMRESAEQSFNQSLITNIVLSSVFVCLAVIIAMLIAQSIVRPISRVADSVQALASNEGDLTQSIKVDTHAELIALAEGLNVFMQKLAEMITVSKTSSSKLLGHAVELSSSATLVEESTNAQQKELDNIAVAMTQMSSTATEVAQLANQTAEDTNECNGMLLNSQSSLSENVEEVNQLAESIQSSSNNVNEVAAKTDDISGILTTIQSIAEQTNLLALNAAIEAARAGDQGRGFAVVADEVRTLAANTQRSTEEISLLISELQDRVKLSVSALEKIRSTVTGTVSKTQSSYDEISRTLSNLQNITNSVHQVATAAEEQSVVSRDVSKRVVIVSDSSRDLASLGIKLQDVNRNIDEQISAMDTQLSRLKT